MLLNELLDREIPYKVEKDTPQAFITSAGIGDREIVVRCARVEFNHNYIWCVEFAEIKDGSQTYKASGSGNELQVFSVVVSTLNELVGRYQPDIIRFTASKSGSEVGNARAKLYGRLAERFKLPGYKLVRGEIGDTFTFELVHSEADERAAKRRAEAEEAKRARMSPKDREMYDMFRRIRERG